MIRFRTLHEALCSERPLNTPLYSCQDRLLTYGDLLACTEQLHKELIRVKAEKALLCISDTFYFTAALCACLYSGKIPILPGYGTPEEAYGFIEEDKAESVIFITDAQRPKDQSSLKAKPDILYCQTLYLKQHGAYESDSADYRRSCSFLQRAPKKDSEILLYTSGSTGQSKTVHKPLYCLEREAVILQELFGSRTERLCVAGTVYPYHMFALTFRIFLPLLGGLLQESGLIHYTEELAARQHKLMLITSPAFLKRLDFSKKAPEIKICVSAGGRLPDETALEFYSWSSCPVDEIYGSTETGVMATRSNRGQKPLWQPFSGMRFTMKEEFFYLSSPLIAEESFRLDDMLEFSEGGFILKGRRGRTVKIEEKRVSLDETEKMLLALPSVSECAVLVIEENSRACLGAVLKLKDELYTELKAGGSDALRRFKRDLRLKLVKSANGRTVPKKFRVVELMPVNHMGKLQAAALKELFYDKT